MEKINLKQRQDKEIAEAEKQFEDAKTTKQRHKARRRLARARQGT